MRTTCHLKGVATFNLYPHLVQLERIGAAVTKLVESDAWYTAQNGHYRRTRRYKYHRFTREFLYIDDRGQKSPEWWRPSVFDPLKHGFNPLKNIEYKKARELAESPLCATAAGDERVQ